MARDEAGDRPAAARWDAISRLAAGLSHEVRNPLNALAIHLEVLAEKLRKEAGGAVPPHLEKNLQAARAQVGRVDAIVRRFADFAGAREFPPGTADARELVEAVVGLCRHEAGRNGVELTAVAPDGLVLAVGGPALAQALVTLVLGLLDGGVGGGRLGLQGRAEGERGAIVVTEEGGGLDLAVARAALAADGAAVERAVAELGGEVAVQAVGSGAALVLRFPRARLERSNAVG